MSVYYVRERQTVHLAEFLRYKFALSDVEVPLWIPESMGVRRHRRPKTPWFGEKTVAEVDWLGKIINWCIGKVKLYVRTGNHRQDHR